MQLYTFPQSHNSYRVTAVAHCAGIKLDLVFIDLAKAEQLSPEFINLNPNHQIPTLVDGEFVLWEAPAIMLYLAELKPESGLIPKEQKQRMKMHQWLAWDAMEFTPAQHTYIYEHRVKKKLNLGEIDLTKLAHAEKNYHRFAAVLDEQLKTAEWVLGDALSLADFHLVAPMIHAESCYFPIENYKHIQRWKSVVFNTTAWKLAKAEADNF